VATDLDCIFIDQDIWDFAQAIVVRRCLNLLSGPANVWPFDESLTISKVIIQRDTTVTVPDDAILQDLKAITGLKKSKRVEMVIKSQNAEEFGWGVSERKWNEEKAIWGLTRYL